MVRNINASGKSYAINYKNDVEIGDKKGVFDEATRQQLLDSYLLYQNYMPESKASYNNLKTFIKENI